MDEQRFFASLDSYFERTLRDHGATARGVDWNSPESQELRFGQLLKVCEDRGPFSIVDYGCGYGALVGYLRELGYDFSYQGFDVSERMLAHARELYGGDDAVEFVGHADDLRAADYCVASGVFNLRMDVDGDAWRDYVLETIGSLSSLGTRGFAFNMLTKYSDPPRMRPDLYYGDPCFFFDHCKREIARDVALLHDYGLYEFTMLVRKEG